MVEEGEGEDMLADRDMDLDMAEGNHIVLPVTYTDCSYRSRRRGCTSGLVHTGKGLDRHRDTLWLGWLRLCRQGAIRFAD